MIMDHKIQNRYAWRDCYTVGNYSLDAHHKEIFGCIHELMQNFSDIDTRNRIDSLEDKIFSHFQEEEEILSDDDYPYVAQHRRIHDLIRKWMYEEMRTSRSVVQ